jgi:queuine tRNA-ribosyltransferase
MVGEMLGPVLVSLHNLTYYQRLMKASRAAIAEGRFSAFADALLARWATGTDAVA